MSKLNPNCSIDASLKLNIVSKVVLHLTGVKIKSLCVSCFSILLIFTFTIIYSFPQKVKALYLFYKQSSFYFGTSGYRTKHLISVKDLDLTFSLKKKKLLYNICDIFLLQMRARWKDHSLVFSGNTVNSQVSYSPINNFKLKEQTINIITINKLTASMEIWSKTWVWQCKDLLKDCRKLPIGNWCLITD